MNPKYQKLSPYDNDNHVDWLSINMKNVDHIIQEMPYDLSFFVTLILRNSEAEIFRRH